MKPIDALRAATSMDAELLGVADRLGSLEAGKIADVIATPRRPHARHRRHPKSLLGDERRHSLS
ncbi:MAG: amidohydrolase family protein [Candidatus Acidiferrales bacterium]